MISAAEARNYKDTIYQFQLEQIEHGIKESIIMGSPYLGYRTDLLDNKTIEQLELLGYKVETQDNNWTKITWEEDT